MHENEIALKGGNDTIVGDEVNQLNSTMDKTNIEMMHFTNSINNLANDKKAKAMTVWENNKDYVYQKIMEFANVGLSIANKDYHFVSYAGIPDFQIDYKGMLKVAAMEARKNGYQLIAKADTIRDGYKDEVFTTNGLMDNIEIVNGKMNAKIITSYAIISLVDMVSRNVTMQKVEVMPIAEFENAKKASKMQGSGANKDYATEMAKKIALRRGIKIISTMFASDVLDKLFSLDNESYDMSYQQTSKPQLAKDLNRKQ